MASKVALGGLAGGIVGGLSFLIPGVGPVMGTTILTSCVGAGAAVGWDATKADIVDRVADRVMGGLENAGDKILDASLKGLKVITLKVGEGSYNLFVQTGRIISTWNAFLVVLVVDGGMIYKRSLLDNQRNGEFCSKDPDNCKDIVFQAYWVGVCSTVLTGALAGKAVSLLFRREEKVPRKSTPPNDVPEPVARPTRNADPQRDPVLTARFEIAHAQVKGEEESILGRTTAFMRMSANWWIRTVMPTALGGSHSTAIWNDLKSEEFMRGLIRTQELAGVLNPREAEEQIDRMRIDSRY